ncbi:hypothetical protein SRHO_G00306260 [Serrasalmus rhombeus]
MPSLVPSHLPGTVFTGSLADSLVALHATPALPRALHAEIPSASETQVSRDTTGFPGCPQLAAPASSLHLTCPHCDALISLLEY